MGEISNFCVEFAKARGLAFEQDAHKNIIIWKAASKGYENHPAVVIQGHLDMVCEKEKDLDFDFRKEGLRLQVSGDSISAQGTTLGGDNAIAIAYALALLDNESLQHPPLEVIFTVDEEIGMLGAAAMDLSKIQGRTLLNLDSEEEGVFTVSCAGGVRVAITAPFSTAPASGKLYKITVSGLLGGHSGIEIHKGRANGNKVLAEVLLSATAVTQLRLCHIEGGTQDNAICRKAEALVVVPHEKEERLKNVIALLEQDFKDRYQESDPDLTLTCVGSNEGVCEIWDKESTARVLQLLCCVPDGVQSMSRNIEGLVETSLNMGIVKMAGDSVGIVTAVRSSVGRDKAYLEATLGGIAEIYGGLCMSRADYPAWEYREDSPLRQTMSQLYREKYGQDPLVGAVHAGLECGVLGAKLQGMDAVSFGPDMQYVHTTEETLSIASVGRVWDYLLELLTRL